MKKDQTGFGVLEALLTLILITLIVGVGFYVKSNIGRQQPTSDVTSEKAETRPEDKDQTIASMTVTATSRNNHFSLNILDGWKVTNDTESDRLTALGLENITYAPNTPATVINDIAFRGGGPTAAYFSIQLTDPTVENSAEEDEEFVTNEGLKGKKSLTVSGGYEGEGVSIAKGTKFYGFRFTKKDKVIVANYVVAPNEPDQIKLVEDMMKTLKVN